MASKNFVVNNGLTSGNIVLDAATANITGVATVTATAVSANTISASGNVTLSGTLYRTPSTANEYFELFDSVTADTRAYNGDGTLNTKTKTLPSSLVLVQKYNYDANLAVTSKVIYANSVSAPNIRATATYNYDGSGTLTSITIA